MNLRYKKQLEGMISGNYASPQLLRKLFSLMVVLLFTSASFGQVISNTGSLPETCFGDCDGAMWFTITGGTAPYFIEYQSNDNPTVFDTFLVAGTDTTFNLCASSGAYTIIVTDGGGGATGASQTLNGPSRIAYLNLGVDTVSCVDTCDGNINGFAVGGNGSNYDYNWSNSGTTATLSNLCAMNYLVTITDDSGCVGIDSVPVINRDTLRINLSTNDATCRGLNNGNSAANVTGGVLPYTYNWTSFNTGQPSGFNTDSIFNLLADTFPLVVTDGNNCPIYDTAIVDEPTGLDIDTTITQVDCFGNNSGEIHLDVSGGIPGYVYNWDPVGAGTDTAATGLVAGTYMVTITDNNGAGACPEVLTIVITEPDSIEITFNNTNVNCFGDATGQSIALLQGGSAPFSYSWNHTALDNDTVMNLSAGNYGLTVTDDEGCSQNALTTITQNDSLEADLSSTPISCATADDGSISANPQGGIGNYAYSWSSGESTQTINSKGPGTYILTLTDDSGCVRIDSLELIEPQSIQANLNITDVSCFNNQNGSAVASPLGGTRPFSYTWVNITTGTVLIAFTDSFATSLDTGNYSLTIQDDEGCTSFTPFSISQPDSILANATSNDLSCFGDLNGMASSAPTGGTGVYTYEWSSNPAVDTLSSVSGIGAGSYTVTVTDASGCTGTQTVTINQPDSIEIVFATSDASCGLCDGDATATVTGGVLPYASLSWSNGDAGTFADQLCTQFYDITVTDDSGCVRIDSVEILSPGSIILNPSQVNNKCSSDNSGEATVSPTGGLGGYIYAWSNGATDSTITGLDTGTYTVTVSDAQPCILTQTFNITSSPEVIVNITQDSASCSNIQDGGATANVTGGTSPFTYLWSNAQTDASATNLGIGFHYVTVTDDSGCAAIDSLEIQPKITIVSGITIVTEDCNDLLCDGTAMASASGGATPYSFSWSSGVVVYSNFDSSLVDSVCGGQLIVIAQDQDGCEGTDTIIMPVAPTVLQVADSIVDISCNGEDDGEFHALVTGGAPPYSYSWSNGETGTFIDSLAPGSYSVTITDTNNCVVDTSGAFINPSQLIATGSGTNITCNGSGNGTATATVIGGTTPYDYLWPVSAGNQTTATATGLNVGSYVATVTDARGCTDTTLVIISEPNGMQSSGSSNQTTCFQDNDGTASVTITGGTSPYNYQWDINTLNQTGMTATGLSAGTYYVTVSDDNSCTLVDSVEVTEPDQFTGSSSVSNLLCSSDSNGIVVVTIAGGTPNYTYLWDAAANNQTTATATGLAPGTYGLTVTDSRGCDSATSVTVTGPPILLGNVNEYDITCGNGNDGAAAIQPQGGTTPYSILWSTGSTLDSLSGLSQGTYYVTLTDDNNCTVMDSAVISEPLPLAANVNVNA
ncbi:MAG: SprB repeat-containing protein, partial [Flavobacteriales bacterium]|nr:SprB repeat-containing protein [Flavobacteriales bacterium]